MPEGRRAAALALLTMVLLAGGRVLARQDRQDDPREREGLRRRRPTAEAPLLLPAGERAPAPVIPKRLDWVQGAPPTAADLKGKVTLVDFWEFTCVNCLRVLPTVEDLHAKYAPAGLVVVGIHTPDFDFSADAAEVASAVKRLGVDWAVANDPLREAWRAFDNDGWPSAFLIDGRGRIAWRGVGEGEYARLEERVRALLVEAGAEQLPQPSFPIVADPFGPGCGEATSEVFAGHARGTIANSEGYAPGAVRSYAPPPGVVPPEGQPLLSGPWIARAEGLSAGQSTGASLALVYQAKTVNVVIHTLAPGPQLVEVTQDGAPLGREQKGDDVTVDAQGRSVVAAEASRLYALVRNVKSGTHRLELRPLTEQAEIASFTFGNDCQGSPPRR